MFTPLAPCAQGWLNPRNRGCKCGIVFGGRLGSHILARSLPPGPKRRHTRLPKQHDEQAMLLRALEEKRFLPLGSDREASSDFQLIAGTNRDLAIAVHEGRFREDLLARMNLWTFRLPGLAERPEDIEPHLDYELDQFARRSSLRATLSKEAREQFLSFARSPAAQWNANFRDLNAC